MPAIFVKLLTSVAMNLLTEKFLLNLIVLLAGRVAKSTDNKLDDAIVEELKKAADGGFYQRNLYAEVKSTK